MVTEKKILEILEPVSDPEVPVLSILDLGIVRNVNIEPEKVIITITPTYSGCPAMQHIESEIISILKKHDIQASVSYTLSPAWTTDWITESGKKKLKEYGIAPPVDEVDKSVLFSKQPKIQCPKCNSFQTKMVSQFGSTACKAHYKCLSCQEPFDYFKCLK